MEETKKSRKDQGGNGKMVIKMGGGGGGGIGAVVLLGGALATAAFASAFVLGQKRWSSDKDHHRDSSPENNEKSEKDEANKDQTFHEREKMSKGAKEEALLESDSTINNSAHSLKVDDVISDDGFVIVKEEIPLLVETDGKDKVQLTKEDALDDYSKESTNLEQVYIEDGSVEREIHGDGEIDTTGHKEAAEATEMEPRQEENSQVCHDQEDIEVTRADNAVEEVQIDQIKADKNVSMELNMEKKEFVGFCNGDGEILEVKCQEAEATERRNVDLSGDGIVVSENHSKNGEKPLLPIDAVEMVRMDVAIMGSEENGVEYIEEKAVNGCVIKQDGSNEVVKEVEEELISHEDVESVKHGENEEAPQKPERNENGDLVQRLDSQPEDHKDDLKRETEKEVEEELIDHGNGKATMSNMVNGDEEVIEKKSSVQTSAEMDSVIMDKNKELNDLSNEKSSVGRGDSSGESKWEALWQAEWPKASSVAPQQVKLMKYEVGGKIQEDKAVTEGKTFIKKYAVEIGMAKDHLTSSTRWRMMVWALSVLSSLSFSWFFDLSFAKLCLVVFLTVFLLEIYGYPLLNRQPAQFLHAAKGERGYELRS